MPDSKRQESVQRFLQPMEKSMKAWAICVGIDVYEDHRIPPLRYAVNDARAVASFFEELRPLFDPKRIKSLHDRDATVRNIRLALGHVIQQAASDDVVFLYFACHGAMDADDIDESGQFDAYLVPHDGIKDMLHATGLPMAAELKKTLARLHGCSVVTIIDSCFSGRSHAYARTIAPSITSRSLPTPDEIHKIVDSISGSGRLLFAACGEDEVALEDETIEHGLFTHTLLELLRSQLGTAPFEVEISALYTKLHRLTHDRSRGRQNPTFSGSLLAPVRLASKTGLRTTKTQPDSDKFLKDLKPALSFMMLKQIGSRLAFEPSYDPIPDVPPLGLWTADEWTAAIQDAFCWKLLASPHYAAVHNRALYLFVVDTGGGRHEQLQKALADMPGRVAYYHVYGRDDALLLVCCTEAQADTLENALRAFGVDRYKIGRIDRLFGAKIAAVTNSAKQELSAAAKSLLKKEYSRPSQFPEELKSFVSSGLIAGWCIQENTTKTHRLRAFCAVRLIDRRNYTTRTVKVFEEILSHPTVAQHVVTAFTVDGRGDADMFFELRAANNETLDRVTDVIADLMPGRHAVESWSFIVAKAIETPDAIIEDDAATPMLWSATDLRLKFDEFEHRYIGQITDDTAVAAYSTLSFERRRELLQVWMTADGVVSIPGLPERLVSGVESSVIALTRAIVVPANGELERSITLIAPVGDYVLKTAAWRIVRSEFENGEQAKSILGLQSSNIGRFTLGQSVEFFKKWAEYRKASGKLQNAAKMRSAILAELSDFKTLRNKLAHPENVSSVAEIVGTASAIIPGFCALLDTLRTLHTEVIEPTGGYHSQEDS